MEILGNTRVQEDETDHSIWDEAALTASEKELLVYFEQTYMLKGVLPGRELCINEGFSGSVYDSALRKTKFHDGLHSRGMVDRSTIRRSPLPDGTYTNPNAGSAPRPKFQVNHAGLTKEQLYVANILLDFRDKRSDAKKLAECDVSTTKYNGWLKDPVFQNYMRTRSEQIINENQRDINEALLNRARGGDMGAINYINKLTGYFDPDKKEVTDVNMVLMSVLDILTRHLSTNPDLLAAVAEEMLTLADKAAPVGTRVIGGSYSNPVYPAEPGKKLTLFDPGPTDEISLV